MTAPKVKKRVEKKLKKPLWVRETAKIGQRKGKKKLGWMVRLSVGIFLATIAYFGFRVLTSGIWDDQERLTLALGKEGESVALISVPKNSDEKVLVFVFDQNVMVDTVYGYGEYRVGSLLKLGSLEGHGSELLVKSLQQTLGFRVYDYLSVSISEEEDFDVDFLRKLVRPMMLSLVGHPLGVRDVYSYTKVVSNLRPDQITVLPIHESRLAYAKKLPDDSSAYVLDYQRVDGYIRDAVLGLAFGEESLGVAIINTTANAGLASSLSRILLNSGVDVVSVGENQDRLDRSVLLVGNESLLKTRTVSFVEDLVEMKIKVADVSEYRAEIVILLGNDYFKELTANPKNIN